MKTYTVKDINKHNPCYNPTRHFDPNKSYTLLDFLNNETCPHKDKIWVVTRFLDDKSNRLFAVWCARRALSYVDNPDPRSVHAVDIAEKYARGEATDEELSYVDNPDPRSVHAVDIAEKYARGEATEEELRSAHDEAYDAANLDYYAYHWPAYWATYSIACTAAYRTAVQRSSICGEHNKKAQIEYLKGVVGL